MDANASQSAVSGPQNQAQPHEHYGLLIVFLIVVVAAFGWWQWKDGSLGIGGPSVLHNPEWAQQSDLSGTMLLTLTAKTGGDIAAYDLNLETGDLVRRSSEEILPVFRKIMSSENRSVVLSGALYADAGVISDDANMAMRVFVAPVSDTATMPDAGSWDILGNTVYPAARDIAVRGNNILFASRGADVAGGNTLTSTDAWGISLSRAGDEPRLLVGGTKPQWVSDTRFVFLRSDGVYVYDTSLDQMVRVIATDSSLGANAHLAVSHDSRYLAFSQPEIGNVTVFEISDWGSGDTVPEAPVSVGSLSTTAFWVVFSPSEHTLALQVVDRESLGKNPNPRLVWYAVPGLAKVAPEFSLNAFDQSYMFITDWVNK